MIAQLAEFITKHNLLVGIAGAILSALGIVELIRWVWGSRPLSPSKVTVLMNRRQAKVLDLREKSAFLKAHLPKTTCIADLPLETVMNQLSPAQPIIFIVSSSMPPFGLLRQLRVAGFSELYHLEGGIAAWQQAGLPIVRS